MQRQFRLGGGVAPKTTLLRGQGIIEYVLIISVIGLVVVFAGPGVAGAIRNQFNLVGSTVDSGATGGVEGGTSGGGSTGTASATVQAGLIGQNVCPRWGHRRRSMPLFQPFKFRARF